MPYFSNFTFKERVTDQSYTATKDCAIYVYTVTTDSAYASIITKIGDTYISILSNGRSSARIMNYTSTEKTITLSIAWLGV